MSRRPARRARRLAGGLAALLAASLTGALATGATAETGRAAPAARPRPAAASDASVASCARPAPAPGVRVAARTPRVPHLGPQRAALARDIAATGRRLGVPARGQAIALMVAMVESDFSPADAPRHLFAPSRGVRDRGLDAAGFYRRLVAVPGWVTLPPTVVAHRASGSADPYAYEDSWNAAVLLLSQLAASPSADVAGAVEAGADAPRRCYASAADPSGLPLPAGSGYVVVGAPDGGTADPGGGSAVPAGRDTPGETEFRASCGTPVLAATAGTVRVVRDDPAAGPWRIGVQREKPDALLWYSHVQRPLVHAGSSVLVGQPLGEVGDLGRIDGCTLGLSITAGTGRAARAVDVLPWLTSHGAAVGEAAAPHGKHHPHHTRHQHAPGDPAPAPAPALPPVVPATQFRAATFNVLGSHLTGPGGEKASYASGASRMARALRLLEASGDSVVTLQEFETPAARAVLADGNWALHRGTPNNRFRNGNAGGNAIAWRRDTWSLVSAGEFTVPWQVTLHMPMVTLRHVGTGAEITVIGVHNPASTAKQGDQQRARDVARGVELSRVRALRYRAPLTPVILSGDMNERAAVFCPFTGSGVLASFAGGSTGGACRTPSYGGVDWIFGTRDLGFDSPRVNRSTRGSISDHPLVDVQVVIPEHPATTG